MFKDNFIWLMAGDLGAKWLGQKKGLQTEQEEISDASLSRG